MKFPKAVMDKVTSEWRWSRPRHQIQRLFSLGGLEGHRAEYRKRENEEPCEHCGATDYAYRWLDNPGRPPDDRWFCFCGTAIV